MKKIVFLLFLVGVLSSCSLIKSSSSKTLDVNSKISSEMQADLKVAPQKTTGTAVKKKGLSLKELKSNAVAEALKDGGDVLVEARYTIEKKRNGKIKRVTVSGYPATYNNFRSQK